MCIISYCLNTVGFLLTAGTTSAVIGGESQKQKKKKSDNLSALNISMKMLELILSSFHKASKYVITVGCKEGNIKKKHNRSHID